MLAFHLCVNIESFCAAHASCNGIFVRPDYSVPETQSCTHKEESRMAQASHHSRLRYQGANQKDLCKVHPSESHAVLESVDSKRQYSEIRNDAALLSPSLSLSLLDKTHMFNYFSLHQRSHGSTQTKHSAFHRQSKIVSCLVPFL